MYSLDGYLSMIKTAGSASRAWSTRGMIIRSLCSFRDMIESVITSFKFGQSSGTAELIGTIGLHEETTH